MRKITLRYSDRYSYKFWNAVNSLKGKAHDKAYGMGCTLQNIEGKVIKFVNDELAKQSEVRHGKS